MSDAPARIHIGTCAWSFDEWRGVFYPEHLPPAERLAFHARHFSTVEIDSTFYHPPAAHVAQHWAEITPHDFVFAAKLSREITHDHGLRDCAAQLDEFLAGVNHLHSKLACVLVQLPPHFSPRRDEHTLRDFVRQLPAGFRFAIEFRDPDWHHPRITHLLAEHGVCWVWNDLSTLEHASEAAFGFWPHTTDFLYLRLMGDLDAKYEPGREHRYRSLDWPRDAALENWAEKVRALLPQVGRVLIQANNHYEGFAPHTAARIAALLGQPIKLPDADELAGSDPRQMKLL
ncbi:MAG: DUF72 domain-containing protein [Chthoniobacteraceae bacterium]